MSATSLSLILLVVAGAVLALGSLPRARHPVPVRLAARVASSTRRRAE